MTGELSWQLRLDGCTYRARGHNGDIYTVAFHHDRNGGADRWHVKHQRGRRVRQLGVIKTLEQAKARAQHDFARANIAD